MKHILIIIGLCIVLFYALDLTTPKAIERDNNTITSSIKLPSLRVVYYLDISGSGKNYGVEFITSQVFDPYFHTIHRDIELNFGYIGRSSAHKLITVHLPACTYTKPKRPDLANVPFIQRPNILGRYKKKLQKYCTDSIAFHRIRNRRLRLFCKQIDSLVSKYKVISSLVQQYGEDTLSKQEYLLYKDTRKTDLVTAVYIARKVFSYSAIDNTKNYLILNSDGQDTYGRTCDEGINAEAVILVNSGKDTATSIDKIITHRFQSSEQAIAFTLNDTDQY